jgi:hypothetical protein
MYQCTIYRLSSSELLTSTTGVRSRVGDTVCRVRVTRRRTTGNVTAATTTTAAESLLPGQKLTLILNLNLIFLVETTRVRVGDTVCRVRVTRRRTTGNVTAAATLLALELAVIQLNLIFLVETTGVRVRVGN